MMTERDQVIAILTWVSNWTPQQFGLQLYRPNFLLVGKPNSAIPRPRRPDEIVRERLRYRRKFRAVCHSGLLVGVILSASALTLALVNPS